MTVDLAVIRSRLAACGQAQLLADFESLDPGRQARLLTSLADLPLDQLASLRDQVVMADRVPAPPPSCQPAPVVRPDAAETAALHAEGEALIRSGKVAAFTVAGGQGTRLGWGGPKGTYPATPVSGKPLFRVFAEQIAAASRRWEIPFRWYIMTSEQNDAATRAFFADNNWFGLPRDQVMLFPQGMMPCFDASSGDILMETADRPALSPDGHGGAIAALDRSGALEQMDVLGIEMVSYFQVDNPIAKVIDPVFIGLHAGSDRSSGQFSSKMVPKSSPEEKVGVFCQVEDHVEVIEYSNLASQLQVATDEAGTLRYNAGNIAIHLLDVPFMRELAAEGTLPWHRAVKKVPYLDRTTGDRITPTEPNAVKVERFIFDALPLATRAAVLEVERAREFAPIKNAVGPDSPASSRQAQSDLFGGWLEARGVAVARGDDGHVLGQIEISPLTAMGPEDLEAADLPGSLGSEDRLAL